MVKFTATHGHKVRKPDKKVGGGEHHRGMPDRHELQPPTRAPAVHARVGRARSEEDRHGVLSGQGNRR